MEMNDCGCGHAGCPTCDVPETNLPPSDLVAQLRNITDANASCYHYAGLLSEAANEIERLRAEPLIWNSGAQERAKKAEARVEKLRAIMHEIEETAANGGVAWVQIMCRKALDEDGK